jgi:hypothetical protein
MTATEGDAYDRGHMAGETNERLAGHDKHFAAINGSLEKLAVTSHEQTMALQRIADQVTANTRAAAIVADALKDAEAARREKSNQTWTPLTRIFAVIAALSTLVGLYLLLTGKK